MCYANFHDKRVPLNLSSPLIRLENAKPLSCQYGAALCHDDGDEDVGLLGVAGQGHEEVGHAKLLVHVDGDAFLYVHVRARSRDVPEGREHLPPAVPVLRIRPSAGGLLAADPDVHVARRTLLEVHFQ